MGRRLVSLLLVLPNYLLYTGVLIWIGLFPVDIANPVHNSRVQSTFIGQEFYTKETPIPKDNMDIIYQTNNYAPSLATAMEAERNQVDKYYNVDDLVLRGLVFVPGGDGYGQIYQPIYEGASNKVLYYGAGTTHPFRYMGENHFTTIGHNMNDGYKRRPSFYSAMQEYTLDILDTKFWSTDGISIFEWTVDSASIVPHYEGQIQDLDSELAGAKYKSNEWPRMTLITCLVDDSYYTRRPENRIVVSGYLNGHKLIEEDHELVFRLFPELGSMKRVARPMESKTKIIPVISEKDPNIQKGVEQDLKKNKVVRFLFYNYKEILVVWGIVNVLLLIGLIVSGLKKR